MTTEVSKDAPPKRPTAIENKTKNLQAKLKRLQSKDTKFEDEGQRREAIARCQAGLDQLKNASASSKKEG